MKKGKFFKVSAFIAVYCFFALAMITVTTWNPDLYIADDEAAFARLEETIKALEDSVADMKKMPPSYQRSIAIADSEKTLKQMKESWKDPIFSVASRSGL